MGEETVWKILLVGKDEDRGSFLNWKNFLDFHIVAWIFHSLYFSGSILRISFPEMLTFPGVAGLTTGGIVLCKDIRVLSLL